MDLKNLDSKKYKHLIIFHSKDFDGHSSGAITYHYLLGIGVPKENITLLGLDYSNSIPWNVINEFKDNFVYMVDFVIQPYESILNISKQSYLTIIDHHKTSYEKLYTYLEDGLFNGILDENTTSACEWCWRYFHPDRKSINLTPKWIQLLAEYDSWKRNVRFDWDSEVIPFQLGMKSLKNDLNENTGAWIQLLKNGERENEIIIKQIIERGKVIKDFTDNQNKNAMEYLCMHIDWEGKRFLVANTTFIGSNQFNSIWENGGREKFDGMISYRFTNDRKYIVSLYTDKPDIDLTTIAVKYGGGGHKGACGFNCDELPFKDELYDKPKGYSLPNEFL